jgi:4'-phosphopantetheinyl transferase
MPEVSVAHSASSSPVQLWRATLEVGRATLEAMSGWLSVEERERAQAYRHPSDRDRFTAARGWLRVLLADQLGGAPSDVGIVGKMGKKPTVIGSALQFSASRSGGEALFATSWSMEVGVDVEAIRPVADLERFATRFFSPRERAALAALPADERLVASFRCWTCKEAYVKGTGTGLNVPIADLETWSPETETMAIGGWVVHQVDLGPGRTAAVAGESLDDWAPGTPKALEWSPILGGPPGNIDD